MAHLKILEFSFYALDFLPRVERLCYYKLESIIAHVFNSGMALLEHDIFRSPMSILVSVEELMIFGYDNRLFEIEPKAISLL